MLRGARWPLVSVEAAGRVDLGVLGRGEAAAMGRWGSVGGSGRQLEAALRWSPGAKHVPVVRLLRMAQQCRDVHAHLGLERSRGLGEGIRSSPLAGKS